jgi:hypothetical protein
MRAQLGQSVPTLFSNKNSLSLPSWTNLPPDLCHGATPKGSRGFLPTKLVVVPAHQNRTKSAFCSSASFLLFTSAHSLSLAAIVITPCHHGHLPAMRLSATHAFIEWAQGAWASRRRSSSSHFIPVRHSPLATPDDRRLISGAARHPH